MTLFASPALQQVESALKVSPGSFTKNNYRSVFDIARTSRKQFIADNMSWLGLRGGKAWDLAVGQAQHIRRLFREKQLTRQIRQSLTQTLSGQQAVSSTSQGNIQGLVQDGPTWQNQFAENWQAYCQSGAPEAVDSPVSYLTWLYKQALTFEEEIHASSTADQVLTLDERRPDLATLTVDNDAVNQQIPALQLVNEILESNIATSLPSDRSVDVMLAETRYPTLLPYHFPHDQVELALLNADVPLEDIIGQTATDWPWFLNDSWRGERSSNSTELASRLAPEQQMLVTEPDNSTASDLTAFYKTNLGVETADYTPFEEIDTFTYQLGITVPQVEELVAGNGEGSTSVVISSNIISANNINESADSYHYGASFINENNASPIALISSSNDYVLSGEPSFISDATEGNAISLKSSEDQYITIVDDFTTINNHNSNFSMGFWVNINSTPNGDVMIGGNTKISHNGRAEDLGFFIQGSSGNFDLNVTDEKGNYKNAKIGYAYNEWNYFIFSVDWQNNQLIICKRTFGTNKEVNSTTIDLSSLTGGMPALNKWYFNNDSGEDYYQRFGRSATIDIQEVAIWNFALTKDEMSAISASTFPAGGRTDMLKFYPFSSGSTVFFNNLSDGRMDRINRMVRLQRWLGLSYEETDLLLSSCIRAQGTDNTGYSLNAHTLRALGVFRHWQEKYGVTAFQFAAVLDQITPYAISPAVPFFDQVFNSPSLFDEPFAITGETVSYTDLTGDSGRTVRQICAGLDITQAQFRVLADKVAVEQGEPGKSFPLTLAVVSAFYRLVMVPRWLGLSFADGAALLSLASGDTYSAWRTLAGVPQMAALTDGRPTGGDILDLLMALDAAAEWTKDHNLSWVKNYLALQPESDALVATSATVNFINDIKQQLPTALLSEQSFDGVPLPADSTASSWLAVFPDLIDGNGLVQEVATDDSTIAAMVDADITHAGITFASDADREQAASALSGIISQARQAQNGIADSALAQMFGTAQSLPPFLLQWAGDSEYRLLSDSLAMNGGVVLSDPSQVPAAYLTDLYALGQRVGISTAFALTPATLSLFLAHPAWFGVSDTTLTLTLLYRFSRYGDWLKVAGDEDRVLAYLSWVNVTKLLDNTPAAKALALLLAWESSEVADAMAALPDSLAKTVTDVDYVMRLQQLSAKTGLSVTPLLAVGELAPGGVSATWDVWQSAGESLVAAQQ